MLIAYRKICLRTFWIIPVVNLVCIVLPSQAEITSDRTLPTKSLIKTQGVNTLIEGGTIRGNNLFHSFSQFSIQKNGEAHFNNAQSIQNIISRITGNDASRIDGLIKANGQSNLFLINPNGLIFGANARLDLGGSFVASTATSILFSDGFELGVDTLAVPINLSISAPVGLRLTGKSQAINVLGNGYSLSRRDPLIAPFLGAGQSATGLRLSPEKSLALIGNKININGGTLVSPSGNISIGSIKSGKVKFNTKLDNWNFEDINLFEDIQLSNEALLDASSKGAISIYGKNINISSGSVALIQNSSQLPSGGIKVFASNDFSIDGISSNNQIPTTITTESVSSGKSGDISINAKRIEVQGGASISSRTYSSGIGGDIGLNSDESIDVTGFFEANPGIISLINTSTVTSGKPGDISINTNSLTAREGGIIIALTLGEEKAGNVNIFSKDIAVEGANSIGLVSSISSNSFGYGDSGSIKVKTSKLKLLEGGTLNAIGFKDGNAGSIYVDASKSILISTSPDIKIPFDTGLGVRQSGITATVSRPSLFYQNLFNIKEPPTGNAGNILINTPNLDLSEGVIVSTNRSTGLGGQIFISANSIKLDSSEIATASFNGSGSEIFIDSDILLLKNKSAINASTGEPLPRRQSDGSFIFLNASDLGVTAPVNQGSGGNISIDSSLLVVESNGSISANSTGGSGGTININTKGLFLSNDSNITASSKAKPQLDGEVVLNAEKTGAEEATAPAPILKTSPQVVSACNPTSGASKFVVMGPGSLREESNQLASTDTQWNASDVKLASPSPAIQEIKEKPVIQEATGWKQVNGNTYLIAEPLESPSQVALQSGTCDKT